MGDPRLREARQERPMSFREKVKVGEIKTLTDGFSHTMRAYRRDSVNGFVIPRRPATERRG